MPAGRASDGRGRRVRPRMGGTDGWVRLAFDRFSRLRNAAHRAVCAMRVRNIGRESAGSWASGERTRAQCHGRVGTSAWPHYAGGCDAVRQGGTGALGDVSCSEFFRNRLRVWEIIFSRYVGSSTGGVGHRHPIHIHLPFPRVCGIRRPRRHRAPDRVPVA